MQILHMQKNYNIYSLYVRVCKPNSDYILLWTPTVYFAHEWGRRRATKGDVPANFYAMALFDILVHESAVEIGANGIIDEVLLFLGLLSGTIFKDDVIIPTSFDTRIFLLLIL